MSLRESLTSETLSQLWSEKDVTVGQGWERCLVAGSEDGGRGLGSRRVGCCQKPAKARNRLSPRTSKRRQSCEHLDLAQ